MKSEKLCKTEAETHPKNVKGHTYTVVEHGLKHMLDFLAHAVALQDVNDAQIQK